LVPGVKSEDPKKHGCPLPEDKDKDTILDPDDACPLLAGVKSEDPKKHGCPLPEDPDKDGFIENDACPFVAGIKSDDPKKNGCPLPSDRDKDGFLDPADACPDEPGVVWLDKPEKNGCPRVTATETEITVPPIEFDQGKFNIRPDAELILFELFQFLKDPKNAWIKKVSIEGHTNDDGNPAANRTLSKNRAASVVKWLTARGIDAKRLTSAGFGQDKPKIPHGEPGAKEKNRRVEYIIVEPKPKERK
jgi:OmpA-OmpF porin, OOP family